MEASLRHVLGMSLPNSSASFHAMTAASDEADPYRSGLLIGVGTVLLTVCLELCSLDAVRKVLRQPDGASLYRTAWGRSTFNNLVIGPVTYYAAVTHFCRPQLVPRASAFACFYLLVVQSIGYYLVHAAMHLPSLYRFHKLHRAGALARTATRTRARRPPLASPARLAGRGG